jgi:RNA polymerase sigma-70 factor (ECF subfamily)
MTFGMEAVIPHTASETREADFAALMAATQRRVFQIAVSILGNPADSEEVAQEAYLRAYRKFGRLRDPNKFRAWVSRITYRLALNRQRSRHRRLARDTAWYGVFSRQVVDGVRDVVNQDYLDRLRKEIDSLPEKLRSVVLLCAVEGMDASEVAAVLDIPAGTVRSRLHSARKRLLERMGS